MHRHANPPSSFLRTKISDAFDDPLCGRMACAAACFFLWACWLDLCSSTRSKRDKTLRERPAFCASSSSPLPCLGWAARVIMCRFSNPRRHRTLGVADRDRVDCKLWMSARNFAVRLSRGGCGIWPTLNAAACPARRLERD